MPGLYLTHTEVIVDPGRPVSDWGLSPRGRERLTALAAAPWLGRITRIIASPERKAQETAAILAGELGLAVETGAGMGENDRSATGFLPPEAFEAAADAFFAAPDCSFRGWETARAAQARILSAVQRALAPMRPDEQVLLVGHGAVGTLLAQALAGLPISRAGDQPSGGGCLFAFDLPPVAAATGWHRIEDCLAAPPGLAPLARMAAVSARRNG